GSGRTDEQYAFWNSSTQHRVLLRVLQEFDDLFEFLLGLIDAGNVGEAHFHVIFREDAVLAARKRHHAAFGPAHPPEEEAPHAEQQHQRNNPAEDLWQPPADHLARVLDAGRVEILDQFRIFDARRVERTATVGLAFVRAADGLIADE